MAARAAEARSPAALAAGMPERAAWDEAVELFRMHHPAWPLPLAESEAARAVGGLIGARRAVEREPGAQGPLTPPVALLRRLPCSVSPRDFAAVSGAPPRPVPVGPAPVPATACAVAASHSSA
jgi:hypothetical protein